MTNENENTITRSERAKRWDDLAAKLNEPKEEVFEAYVSEWFTSIDSDQFFSDVDRGIFKWNPSTRVFDCHE